MKSLLLIMLFSLGTMSTTQAVPFKLLNPGMKSIPLIIPGVMNPNLSPMSSSGVNLKVGQEILFKYNGKREVLLVVTEDLADTKLNVKELLQNRIKEINSAKKKKGKKGSCDKY